MMKMNSRSITKNSLQALLFLISTVLSWSFTPTLPFWSTSAATVADLGRTTRIPISAHSGDLGSFGDKDTEDSDDSGEDKFEGQGLDSSGSGWNLYNDFPLFLTQCSVQSFLFLLKQMRDPQTVLWMENFTQPAIHLKEQPSPHKLPIGGSAESQLLNYHGLHAINTTLFASWESYFSKLLEQPQEIFIIESHYKQFPDYELEINPVRLCTRLLAVREQISKEFVKDLGVIANMTSRTLESYWVAIKNNKQGSTEGGALQFHRENLMFLDMSPSNNGLSPSPLRKGNFDLLTLLTTQEAVHRVLRDPVRQKGTAAVGTAFLQDFYLARLVSHFSGSQRYGRANDFLEELLSMSPTIKVEKGQTTLINPAGIAEDVLKAREKVALEWMSMAQQVPDEHLEIQRLTLNQMLSGGTGTSFEDALRGKSNIFAQEKKQPEKETVSVGEGKEAKKGPFDLLSLPPMSTLWSEDGANMNAPGVFE